MEQLLAEYQVHYFVNIEKSQNQLQSKQISLKE